MSVLPRLRRLFGADGRCFDVAVDHGFFGEPRFLGGIEDLPAALDALVEAGPDAIQLSPGAAGLLQDRPGPKPALVMRTDVANVYGPRVDDEAAYFSHLIAEPVEAALRLDAACVVVNLLWLPNREELLHGCLSNVARLKALMRARGHAPDGRAAGDAARRRRLRGGRRRRPDLRPGAPGGGAGRRRDQGRSHRRPGGLRPRDRGGRARPRARTRGRPGLATRRCSSARRPC